MMSYEKNIDYRLHSNFRSESIFIDFSIEKAILYNKCKKH